MLAGADAGSPRPPDRFREPFRRTNAPHRRRSGSRPPRAALDPRRRLSNLIELCAFHHRLVHEGGWAVTFDSIHEVTFVRPDGTAVHNRCRATGSAEPYAPNLETHVTEPGVRIAKDSVTSKWYGDPLDLGLILPAFEPTSKKARRAAPREHATLER